MLTACLRATPGMGEGSNGQPPRRRRNITMRSSRASVAATHSSMPSATHDPYAPPSSYHDIELPKNSMTGPVMGVVGAATAFGLVWHMWWLAIIGTLSIVTTVIARSFARDVHRIIHADEVEHTEQRWLRAVAEATPIPREVEMTCANQGLTEVSG